ncbi:MAG TPA: hypothetical protein VHA11_00155 [Bryobacteraceae bacterium]|nr:hypothetical protein [Bryobacteraceae bacterium]
MGVNNIKFETEVFQQLPAFQFGGTTPVETKPDTSLLTQIASHLAQLTVNVNQLTQAVAAQSFTRAVSQAGPETMSAAEEVRKLNQRMDDLEARIPKTKAAAG